MKKRSMVAMAAALVCGTVAMVSLAAPMDKPGPGGNVPGGIDNESYPTACASPTAVDKVTCPGSINYTQVTSAQTWTSTTEQKPAGYVGASLNTGSPVTLTCQYTTDGADRITIHKTNPKACVVAKKFAGFNCCK